MTDTIPAPVREALHSPTEVTLPVGEEVFYLGDIVGPQYGSFWVPARDLKAKGDPVERLRAATTILRRYIQANHFEGRKRHSGVVVAWIRGYVGHVPGVGEVYFVPGVSLRPTAPRSRSIHVRPTDDQ